MNSNWSTPSGCGNPLHNELKVPTRIYLGFGPSKVGFLGAIVHSIIELHSSVPLLGGVG